MTLLEDFKADCELRNIDRHGSYYMHASKFCSFLESRGKDPCQVGKDDLKAYLQRPKDFEPAQGFHFLISLLCVYG